mgnify:CR=1 FL=1
MQLFLQLKQGGDYIENNLRKLGQKLCKAYMEASTDVNERHAGYERTRCLHSG